MNDDAAALNLEQLLDLVDQQGREIERLRAEVERLKAELEKARRAGKRQAAPFSRGEPKARPKRPGRPPGHAPSHRQAPTPEQVDRVIDVPLPEQCPACQAPLDDLAPEQVELRDQYRTWEI